MLEQIDVHGATKHFHIIIVTIKDTHEILHVVACGNMGVHERFKK